MDTSKIKEIKGIKEIRNNGNIIWRKVIYDETDAPGPKKMIGGNLQAGFFGEVSTSSFITGDELARMISLTTGTSQYSNEPWLKFSYMGKIEFIAKKPFRYNLSWNSINEVNAVFGNRTIRIKGRTYKIRLMKGKTEGKQGDQSSYSRDINKGSEWNKLLLPIHKNAPSSWKYPANVKSPTEDWGVKYSDEDLITNNTNGSYCWCQEYGESSSYRLYRGNYGVCYSNSNLSSLNDAHYGWRPVLEFVK